MEKGLKGPGKVRDDTLNKCIRGTEDFKRLEKQKMKKEGGEKLGELREEKRREESEGVKWIWREDTDNDLNAARDKG